MIEYKPLDPTTLSPAAQKALGPGPGRMMASRGLVPLPPFDQLSVLYQLSLDADGNLANAARNTAAGLPEKVLIGALADPKLDKRVLDMFATLVEEKPAAFEAMIGNPSLADETVAKLAARAESKVVDRIAENEQRLLRHPEIIAALYLNKNARMSTVDRVIELAVRNNVRVPGLGAWDEIARALQGGEPLSDEGADDLFAEAALAASGDDSALTTGNLEEGVTEEDIEAATKGDDDEKKALRIDQLSIPAKIRLATLGNAFARGQLIRDPIRMVAMAAIKSPGVTAFEAKGYAKNRNLPEDVIRFIASNRSWTKGKDVQMALCYNPKTPLPDAVRMLTFMREKELANLARSKGVPSSLVAQARRILIQRRGGSTKGS
jgi:hypothetical protein